RRFSCCCGMRPRFARRRASARDQPELAPEGVRLLADQVGRTMTISMTRRLALVRVVILAGAVVLGAAVLAGDRPEPPAKPKTPERPGPRRRDRGGHLILDNDNRRFAVKLGDGTEKDLPVSSLEVPQLGDGDPLAEQTSVKTVTSPDGKLVVYE